ncbi:hypothetical protein DFH09DRAFT_1035925 [Mycena vulgaris]|nr:hypothetical protein DFH09DRAFT_1035925 [Mycena vulgaris]
MHPATLEYIINHLFLPPRLPQKDDSLLSLQKGLLNHISDCARSFCEGLRNDNVPNEVQARWATLRRTLENFASVHGVSEISRDSLQMIIIRMQLDDVLCLHITSQNAGVILRRGKTHLTLEFFQASPTTAGVTGTQGKLVIQFPSRPRLSLPIDEAFNKTLSALLADLDCTEMPDAIPKTRKAHSAHDEFRDVPDIRYISELLGGIARALTPVENAAQIAAQTVYTTKRINDHVLWRSALLPWRRSPKWLVIRVALQTTLEQWGMPEKYGYKAFITFVLAKTLELSRTQTAGVTHDLLFVMSAKVATRLWKLRSVFDMKLPIQTRLPFPIHFLSQQMSAVGSFLHKHWKDVQDDEAVVSSWVSPTPEQIAAAQTFTLPRSSVYLEAVRVRALALNAENDGFQPRAFEDQLRSDIHAHQQTALSPGVATPDLWLKLLDLEQWIAAWTDTSSPQQLSTLADLIEEHEALASSFKSRNPEVFSRIFLIVLELWVALDKSATSQFPLLLDYSPELDTESFEPLLLPELIQMQRLHEIERYLVERTSNARYPHHSVFAFDTHTDSLPSRHFSRDADLQNLQRYIETQASHLREEKIQELRAMNRCHTAILEEISGREHEYSTNGWGNRTHARWCYRCAKQREADNMAITVFERPLPEEQALTQLVLFELSLPTAVGIWRDTTYRLARNHSKIEPKSNSPAVVLQNYSLLKDHFVSHSLNKRITIASTAKSFLQSHYKTHSVPCTENDVILHHPLHYQLWDNIKAEWLPSEFPNLDIRNFCTPQFPPGPYRSLAWTAVSTTHTPNDVIARQSECPVDLSYHEWEGFGHLRAGIRLQWRNMMLQFITGTIDLADPAVYLLFRQAAWQAETALDGEELDYYREAHFDLSQKDFGVEMVDVLHKRLETISGNWKEGWTAATLGVIACRLLSLNRFKTVKTKALTFLFRLRQILFEWMKQVLVLLAKLSATESSAVRADLVNRVLQLATSCRSTYAVRSRILRAILSDDEALFIFIRSAITLHTYTPAVISSLPSALRYSLERDTIISAGALTHLVDAISRSGHGLDDAVLDVWEGFCRDAIPWRNIGGRWVACTTSSSSNKRVRSVHVNLLNGSFLVDGQAQGTLPKEIERHPLFLALFPNRVRSSLDITPSTMKGMDYQSRDNMDGFEVHFKLTSDELFIRIRDASSFVSEFVPSKYLEGDIPTDLLVGKAHIFHEHTECMDIYPAPRGWHPLTQAAWQLDLAPQSHTTLRKNGSDESALDPRSSIVQQLSEVFRPLETRKTDLTVYSRSGSGGLRLPRYDLEFFVAPDGLLESKELPGFYVSPTQSIGTLIGLQSKLVLKSRNGEMMKVFIPEGKFSVSWRNGDSHPKVTISPFVNAHRVKTFSYDIDDIVGRLVGDGSLTSWYRLAYLHIVTTSYLPDPLTHRTGLRQAQEMLESAQSFAFMNLEEDHNVLLQQILDLAPIRQYYPEHLTSMEKIKWREFLPPLTQCGQFLPLVNAIVDYARKQALFHAPAHQSIITAAYRGKSCLWNRAEYRLSRLVSTVPNRSLGCSESHGKERVVAETAALVHQWPTSVNTPDDLWRHFKTWGSFSSEPAAENRIDNPRVWLKGSPSEIWFRLFHLCRASLIKDRDQYGLMVALGIFAYRGDMDLEFIRTLLAIATNAPTNLSPAIRAATDSIPMDTFDLASGHTLAEREVREVVTNKCRSVDETDAASLGLTQKCRETPAAWDQRIRSAFHSQMENQCETLTGYIFAHWPLPGAVLTVPAMASLLPDSSIYLYPIVEIADLRKGIEALFTTKLHNRHMFERVGQLQHTLNTVRGPPQTALLASLLPSIPPAAIPPQRHVSLTLGSLLRRRDRRPTRMRDSSDSAPQSRNLDLESVAMAGESIQSSQSRQLISRLERMQIDGPKSRYIADLTQCVKAFEVRDPAPPVSRGDDYEQHSAFSILDDAIQTTLSPHTLLEHLLHQTGQWPSSGPESLVRQLSREAWHVLPESWKITLSRYAEGLAEKQQRRRIAVLSRSGFEGERAREVETRGSQGWDPRVYPDWLLVQLDADLLIRPVQASIAQNMMSPDNKKNALMQLNMGEGKSSVIVPIISAALANGKQLVRVIVLKPLSAQMFQLLKQRVCGLANRRLFYLPFSRDIQLDGTKIEQIVALLKECARIGGILLCQPEHILSFQLMGLHAFCQTESGEDALMLREAQEWLDGAARDILDESDEILNVRYQLIYTIGAVSPLEGCPWRWDITQAVFSLLQKVAVDDVEMNTYPEPRRFPLTRILTGTGRQGLVQSIIDNIVFKDGLQEWISFRICTSRDKTSVSRFLSQLDIAPEDARSLYNFSEDQFSQLLLLRGLFAHGIFALSLQEKRWRVDYGLDPRRSMLAVPYRAKDSPAARAEFGHPDMIIVLTCLSYYYGGLTDDQLNTAFKFLLNCDNPEAQYGYWVNGIDNLPPNLASLRGLNLDDFEQRTKHIFPLLRYNKAAIDFYLSECVFPKEAREFQYKLTTNAWDLARTREKLTTGFSGTNDNKYLLPLSIKQLDQESQRHTNAQVLEYILQPENRRVLCTNSDNAMGLLWRLVQQTPSVTVLLDVGAQVLELKNEEVAREWLKLDTRSNIEAAVFFDPSSDEIRVVSRDGRAQPFASSLYKTQLQKTLVYLDEAHTRGTDFKFPAGSRAVVTLGPKLTKDKLVQGCMRMRRLGKDHSVLFFTSAEIWSKIKTATQAQDLDSSHVLLWTIQETCTQIRDNGSLWANQGRNFDARRTALEEYPTRRPYPSLVAALQEREARSLKELYGDDNPESRNESEAPKLSPLQIEIDKKCEEFGIVSSHNALSEEQERELAHEKEDERELERIAGAKPLDHRDDDLRSFINTGVIRQPNSFISLEDCLANTSWISLLPQGTIFRGNNLRATKDFRDTVVLPADPARSMDSYLRPVQWILSSSMAGSDVLVLISPYEANEWLPLIRHSKFVSLHLYSPRVSRSAFWSFERLDSFTVPRQRRTPNRQLIHKLNLFAGQLFCADKTSMKEVCGILGLHLQSVNDREDLQGMVDPTGFVRDRRARMALAIDACAFDSTPLPFFRQLYAARRKGQGFALTHMGQILRGNDPKDPDFEEMQGDISACEFEHIC